MAIKNCMQYLRYLSQISSIFMHLKHLNVKRLTKLWVEDALNVWITIALKLPYSNMKYLNWLNEMLTFIIFVFQLS